jgi:hypothetical protein
LVAANAVRSVASQLQNALATEKQEREKQVEALGNLFLTHHAVWHAPNGQMIDVTPYPDPKHHPLAPGGSILFSSVFSRWRTTASLRLTSRG